MDPASMSVDQDGDNLSDRDGNDQGNVGDDQNMDHQEREGDDHWEVRTDMIKMDGDDHRGIR